MQGTLHRRPSDFSKRPTGYLTDTTLELCHLRTSWLSQLGHLDPDNRPGKAIGLKEEVGEPCRQDGDGNTGLKGGFAPVIHAITEN